MKIQSFDTAINQAQNFLNDFDEQNTLWFGKKIYLGFSEEKGWIVYELNFFSQILRYLNLDYRDTHLNHVISNLEKLKPEEVLLLPTLAEKMPRLKEKIETIYNHAIDNLFPKNVEEKAKSNPIPLHLEMKEIPLTSSESSTSLSSSSEKTIETTDEEKIETEFVLIEQRGRKRLKKMQKKISRSPVSRSESPPVKSPLFLSNYEYSRCYIDSVLEMMLSQEHIRKKIFEISSDPNLPSSKKEILDKIKNLLLIVDETQGKGKGNQSPLGKNSPAEKVREAIFASGLTHDLNLDGLYTQQDAAEVVRLINDVLGDSFKVADVDRATQEIENEKGITIRPADTVYKLELRFKKNVFINHAIKELTQLLIPLLTEEDSSIDDRNSLIEHLIPYLEKKNSKELNLDSLIDRLKKITTEEEEDLFSVAYELYQLGNNLKTDLIEILDQFFSPEIAETSKGEEEKRDFTLKGKTYILPYETQPKLLSLPETLTLHLCRFMNDPYSGNTFKLNEAVVFPKDGVIDMTPYLMDDNTEPFKYEITGYVMHTGTKDGGHYTSNIKIGDTFYHCDDMYVKSPYHREISREEFYSNHNAYLVMLKRIPNPSLPHVF